MGAGGKESKETKAVQARVPPPPCVHVVALCHSNRNIIPAARPGSEGSEVIKLQREVSDTQTGI